MGDLALILLAISPFIDSSNRRDRLQSPLSLKSIHVVSISKAIDQSTSRFLGNHYFTLEQFASQIMKTNLNE